RSGTENVIGVAGAGAAVRRNHARLTENISSESQIREYLVKALSDENRFPGVKLNIPKNPAPHILSVRLPDIKSEVMLHSLSHDGIYVSSGSACSSNTGHGSYVLKAFGLTDREADSTVRISLGAQNTLADADRFLSSFSESLATLVRMVRR
ncbi:MAG: aminotransferase class V-fold PLP-dependent enzyme, partial [Candidatus Flemingiibacterium sp.]